MACESGAALRPSRPARYTSAGREMLWRVKTAKLRATLTSSLKEFSISARASPPLTDTWKTGEYPPASAVNKSEPASGAQSKLPTGRSRLAVSERDSPVARS